MTDMLTQKDIEFIIENEGADTSKLLLGASKYPDVNVKLCVNCIESRQKIKSKLPQWYSNPALAYPFPLSAEQCSSEATGRYKMEVMEEIVTNYKREDASREISGADLTGGMGVDSWFLSQIGRGSHNDCGSLSENDNGSQINIHYFERNAGLCEAANYNFNKLGTNNISVHNIEIGHDNITQLPQAPYDFIFIDPARRSKADKSSKVISLQDYEPNLIELKGQLFSQAPVIMAKVSPMTDIKLNLKLLPETTEVHIVSVDNECKELLFILANRDDSRIATNKPQNGDCNEPEINGEGENGTLGECVIIKTVNIKPRQNGRECFSFTFDQEERAMVKYANKVGNFLYEPNKSILKAGAFKLVSERFNAHKLAPSTHLYTSEALIEEFPGKIYLVEECIPFSKKTIREVASKYPKADLTARNFPLDTNAVKKLSGIKDGGEKHIFATTLNSGEKIIIIASLRK